MIYAFITLITIATFVGWQWWRTRRQLAASEARCEQLRQSEARFQAIADCTYALEAWINPQGRLVWVNRSVERLAGYTPIECLVQHDFVDLLIAPEDREEVHAMLAAALSTRGDGCIDTRLVEKSGKVCWVALSWQAINSREGDYLGLRLSVDDIGARKETEQNLTQQATRDGLTGIYNRRRFDEDLPRMLADALRRNVQLGMLVIDLDGFKPINDTYGHQAGDAVLAAMAAEVNGTTRRSESLYRIGGDEFALLVGDTSAADMQGLTDRIRQQISALEVSYEGNALSLGASLGVAIFPQQAGDAEALMAAADRAMYADKAARHEAR